MRTDTIRAEIRRIHERANAMANECHTRGRGAKVLESGDVAISAEDCVAIGEMLHTLMGATNSTLHLLDQESELADQYRRLAFDGMAFLGFVKGLGFRQLLAWWLRNRNQATGIPMANAGDR